MTQGERLIAWRVRQGISQREASMRAGVSQAAYCHYELGVKTPRLENAFAIERMTDGEVAAAGWQPTSAERRARAKAKAKRAPAAPQSAPGPRKVTRRARARKAA